MVRKDYEQSVERGVNRIIGAFVYLARVYFGNYPRNSPPKREEYSDVLDIVERKIPFAREK